MAFAWIDAQQWKTQSETSILAISEMKNTMQHEGAQVKLRMHQESNELKGQMQAEYTKMQGQMQQEATFYHQHCRTLACEYQAELNLRPVVTLPEQEWAARLRLEEHQIAILRTSMHNVEQEVMRAEKDSEKKLEAETFKYLYEADACGKNRQSYHAHAISRDEALGELRSGAVYSKNLAENADARLRSKQDQLWDAEAESRLMVEAQEAMEFRIHQVCDERNTAMEGIRDLRNELLGEQIAHQTTDTDHQQLLEEYDLLREQTALASRTFGRATIGSRSTALRLISCSGKCDRNNSGLRRRGVRCTAPSSSTRSGKGACRDNGGHCRGFR